MSKRHHAHWQFLSARTDGILADTWPSRPRAAWVAEPSTTPCALSTASVAGTIQVPRHVGVYPPIDGQRIWHADTGSQQRPTDGRGPCRIRGREGALRALTNTRPMIGGTDAIAVRPQRPAKHPAPPPTPGTLRNVGPVREFPASDHRAGRVGGPAGRGGGKPLGRPHIGQPIGESPPDWGSTTGDIGVIYGAIVACSPTIGLPGL